MPHTRRNFLRTAGRLGVGLTGAASTLAGQSQSLSSGAPQAQPSGPLTSTAQLQVPRIKFGNVEISRLVLGVNPFYGFAHYNNNFSAVMKEWYSQDRVCSVMHECNRYGIN